MTVVSKAFVRTPHADRYLQQLCKHWSHKFEVEFEPNHGRVTLPFGESRLSASSAALTVVVETADSADVERPRQIVADHINRFAFREGALAFEWTIEPDQERIATAV